MPGDICSICSMRFVRSDQRPDHMREYKTQHTLIKRIRRILGSQPLFEVREVLEETLRVLCHADDKNDTDNEIYRCPECCLRFPSSDRRLRHYRIHYKLEPPETCLGCDVSLQSASHVVHHYSQCDACTNLSDDLKKTMQSKRKSILKRSKDHLDTMLGAKAPRAKRTNKRRQRSQPTPNPILVTPAIQTVSAATNEGDSFTDWMTQQPSTAPLRSFHAPTATTCTADRTAFGQNEGLLYQYHSTCATSLYPTESINPQPPHQSASIANSIMPHDETNSWQE